MGITHYGNLFVIISKEDSELSRAQVIDEYEAFVEGTRQASRKAKDREALNALPANKKYTTLTRQWAGHERTPDRVSGKFKPLFVSEVVKWTS